ncbi:DUF2971 domain-containing protein [Streptomyces sp. NPDC001586]|uniref:DUF2971 domain-containing protein n=1 Tax=unclassified Streptomyces TaxID=2593676 RepID=UPI00332C8F91
MFVSDEGRSDSKEVDLLAQRRESGMLFHYTSADTAIFLILRSGMLRLSPFESTNDLWEARPDFPVLTFHYADLNDESWRGRDRATEAWTAMDRNIRLHAKVVCLTRDFELPEASRNPDALRGWAHLSLWAHYGASHSGVCLGFDRDTLIRALDSQPESDVLKFHGPVSYLEHPPRAGEFDIDMEQIRQFGVDAVALTYAEANASSIFFSKHKDWASESEYRVVLLNQSVLPSFLPINDALTDIYLGDAFPDRRVPALLEALAAYPDVDVWNLKYGSRRLAKVPLRPPPSAPMANNTSRLGGSLADRRAALRAAEHQARELRNQAKQRHRDLAVVLLMSVEQLSDSLREWPETKLRLWHLPVAVPPKQRALPPGVPGERVHWDFGAAYRVTRQPAGTPVLEVSAAVQVLDDDQLRLHAAVAIERRCTAGIETKRLWHRAWEVPAETAGDVLAELFANLRGQARKARSAFYKLERVT